MIGEINVIAVFSGPGAPLPTVVGRTTPEGFLAQIATVFEVFVASDQHALHIDLVKGED